MWGVPTIEKKRALRTAALSQRKSLSDAEFLSQSRLIQTKAVHFPPYISSHLVALYSSVQNEVGTDDILEHALQQGKKVFYPVLRSRNLLELLRVHSVADLQVGCFGIREPSGHGRLSRAGGENLVVFVPGVAFDLRGNRLGRGQGCYDRLLERLDGHVTSVALAYEFQIVDEVPVEEWDQRVDYIITETRVIDCATDSTQSTRSS